MAAPVSNKKNPKKKKMLFNFSDDSEDEDMNKNHPVKTDYNALNKNNYSNNHFVSETKLSKCNQKRKDSLSIYGQSDASKNKEEPCSIIHFSQSKTHLAPKIEKRIHESSNFFNERKENQCYQETTDSYCKYIHLMNKNIDLSCEISPMQQMEDNLLVNSSDSDEYFEVANVSLQTSMNTSVNRAEKLASNQICREKVFIDSSISASNSDSFVEVADVCLQTSLNNTDQERSLEVKYNTSELLLSNSSNKTGCHGKLLDYNDCSKDSSCFLSRPIKTINSISEIAASITASPSCSFVEVADISLQTSLAYKTEHITGSSVPETSKDSSLINNLTQFFTTALDFLSENDSNDDSELITAVGKNVFKQKILAFDSDEETTDILPVHPSTSQVIEESFCEESDNPEHECETKHSLDEDDSRFVAKQELIKPEVTKYMEKKEASLLTRYRNLESSSSDDDFENFLTKTKQVKRESSKLSLKEFIVDDDIEDEDKDERDEMFYVNVNKKLEQQDNSFVSHYHCELSSSSDDDEWSLGIESLVKTTPLKKEKSAVPLLKSVNVFLMPESTPKCSKVTKPREKFYENEAAIYKKEQFQESSNADKEGDDHIHFLQSLSHDFPDYKRHSKASRYVNKFKETKLELAQHLLNIFNDMIFENKLPKELTIEWNPRYTKTAGTFYYKGTINNFIAKVTLSVKVCDSAERVRDTLAHELCHAAVKLINGANDGHGPIWKSWAKRFNKKYRFMPVIVRCHDYSINTKYTYQCTKCNYRIYRHSKSMDTEAKVCGHCLGKFEVYLTKDLNRSTSSSATPRTPNKFALFVKECYSTKRKETGMKHGEVMRLLSREFAEKNCINN